MHPNGSYDGSGAAVTVSIIIPVFNDRTWVRDAVDSALSQHHGACEIIIVDDGSTDGTYELLRDTYGDRVEVIRQENRGLPAARNVGLARATGQFVQFLDADDVLLPDKISTQIRAFRDHPDISVTYCNFAFVDDHSLTATSAGGFDNRFRSGLILLDLINDNFIVVHAALCRRADVVEAGGFDESLTACEDYDLWLRLAARGRRFLYTPGVMVLYRRRQNSMSRDTQRQIGGTIAALEKVSVHADLDREGKRRHGERLAGLREMAVRALMVEAWEHLRHRRVGSALRRFAAAIAYDPKRLPHLATGLVRMVVARTRGRSATVNR